MHSASQFPNLLETPGIYYAVSYWCASLVMLQANPQRYKGIRKWGLLIGCGVFLCFFMTVTKTVSEAFFIPLMLVDAGILFFIFFSLADIPVQNCVYFTVRAFIMGEFVASFAWQLFAFVIRTERMRLGLLPNLVIILPVYLIFYIAFYFLEKRFRADNAEFTVSWTAAVGVFLTAVVVYFFSNISFAFQDTPFSARFTNEILLLRTAVDSCGLAILFLYHVMLHNLHAQLEVKTLQNMLDTQYANYQTSRNSVELINQKYHDLKHQIAILRAETGSGAGLSAAEKEKYLDRVEDEIRQYEAENKTGNKVLDIILTNKSLQCQRHHIELTVVADGHAIDFMDTMDISSLFGNALDNAIESVRKIDNYAKRLIHLTIVRQKAFVRIQVENTYTGDLEFRNGLPLTTKGDTGYHGFGVRSMRATAEKYGGSLTVDTKDDWFRLSILLPEKPEKDP